METFMALPGADYIYSEYDLGIIADILTTAEHSALKLAKKGKGEGDLMPLAIAPMHALTINFECRQWRADLAEATESL